MKEHPAPWRVLSAAAGIATATALAALAAAASPAAAPAGGALEAAHVLAPLRILAAPALALLWLLAGLFAPRRAWRIVLVAAAAVEVAVFAAGVSAITLSTPS